MTYAEVQAKIAEDTAASNAIWRRQRRDELRLEIREMLSNAKGTKIGIMADLDGDGMQFMEKHNRLSRYLQDAVDEWGSDLTDEQVDAVVILEMQHFGLDLTGRDLLA